MATAACFVAICIFPLGVFSLSLSLSLSRVLNSLSVDWLCRMPSTYRILITVSLPISREIAPGNVRHRTDVAAKDSDRLPILKRNLALLLRIPEVPASNPVPGSCYLS